MKIESKKLLKMFILLLTSMIIATVSAQVYKYMYIDGSITIGIAELIWIAGSDAPSDISIDGGTVTMDLDVEPGVPVNFTYCLFLKNQDSEAHNLTISVTTTVSTADFDECKMHIYENSTGSWVYVDTLDLTTTDSYDTRTNNEPLGAGEYYRMTFEISAKSTATGTKPFDITVEYED